ncbi:MAG: carboxypeptidase regulatory-like domain-containing protein [Acidobacteriota bacterium]
MVCLSVASGVSAQNLRPRKLGELDLLLSGLSATVDPVRVTVPKNTASGVRIAIRSGAGDLSVAEAERLLGGAFVVEGDLAGPGLPVPVRLPQSAPADPLLVNIPPIPQSGLYTLSNLRVTVNGSTALDITPSRVDVDVIEQVLITSVTTRPLTLDEIKARGIILDDDSYLGFEFTLGLSLDSKRVDFSFPVVFDNRGVAVPQPLLPGGEPDRATMPPLTTIVPMLLKPSGDGGMPSVRLPNGKMEEVRIPSVLVIPGNVGYLKQFFSAKLFVANGAPGSSNLTVHDVQGTIKLPFGSDHVPGTSDDPLMLPDTTRGPQPFTMPVAAPGPDGLPGTADDIVSFRPGEQGEVEFVLRGEKEGFHQIDFDIEATLEGLVTGPVTVKGAGSGGVLVRNPYFDMTFTAPAVVRQGEPFKLYVTVNNISQSLANDVRVTLDGARMSGARLGGDATKSIDTLPARDAKTLEFDFIAERTGQVVATYLNTDTNNGSTGTLKFTLGVGERGIPLSPDTLVLPVAVDRLPPTVVAAAMRVLGQAWSISNAPSGTLPRNVIRTSRNVVTEKALALAEAGLRVELGQPVADAVRDLLFDFYGSGAGTTVDAGFDQLLRTTNAGSDLARAIGNALQPTADLAGGAAAYERTVSRVGASGPAFVAFAFGNAGGAPVTVKLTDRSGNESITDATSNTFVNGAVSAAVAVPFGTSANASRLVLLPNPSNGPYTLELLGTGTGTLDVSVTVPDGDHFLRGTGQINVTPAGRYRIVADDELTVDIDANGNGSWDSQQNLSTETLSAEGPRLISVNVVGPETLAGAAPFGFQTALLFDRIVDAASAGNLFHYTMTGNRVVSARRQLSGRIVFASLEQPEGPYVPGQISVNDIRDLRGEPGPSTTVALGSRLTDIGAVVSGRVLSADGLPMANALVTYSQNPEFLCIPPFGDYRGLTQIRTGDDGRYELRYVRQDSCGMAFLIGTREPVTDALRQVSSSVRAAGEQIVLDIAMFGRGSVSGVVRGLNGSPVAGATVVVLSQTDTQSHGTATSDSQGRYRVDDLVVGAVTVRAVKDAALGKSFGRIDRAGSVASVDLTLDGGTVTAHGIVRRVQGSDAQPVPNQQVVYRVKANDGTTFIPVALADTEDDGSYLMTGLPTGEYRIEAALNSRDRGAATGVAAAGDNLNRDINIVIGNEGYGTVRGVVRFPDGAAAPDVVVSIDGSGVLTGADGSFELVGLAVKPDTQQSIRAQSRDGLREGSTRVLISQPGQVLTNIAITLSGVGTVELTVLDANRNPVVNQEVDLLGACANLCGCSAKNTNTQGKVTFTNIHLGTVYARALRSSGEFWDQADAQVSLPSDGSTAFGVLIFPGAGTVIGTVLNPDGSPALGADVILRAKVFDDEICSLTSGQAQRMRTDAQGKFRFTGVNVGAVSVTVTHPFFTTSIGAQGTLTENGATIDFTPLRLVNTISGVLSGTVYLPDGVTPAGAGVEVTAVGPLPEVTVSTNINGRFEFAKIFPGGNYTLTASDSVTGGLRRDNVTLTPAQDVVHDIRLKGRGTVNVRVVDGANQPVTNAFVRLEETQYPNRVYEAAVAASNQGVATFSSVFEGPVTARASDAFARGGRSSSTLASAGATLEMTVALTTTGTVRGHFYRAGGTSPIPFGSVKLVANGQTIGQATTAGSEDVGAFSFSYVPAGSFRIEAQDPQTARSGIAVGTLTSEGQIVEVNVTAQGVGRVEGLVTSNGAPQPGALVKITSGNQFSTVTLTDSAGRYSIDGVPEGFVTSTASLSGNFLAGTSSGNLTGEAATLTLNVALRDSGRITGHVVTAVGATAAPISLVTVQVGGTGGAKLEATTDVAGAFAFERVPAGFATLTAEVLGSIDKANNVADVVGSQTTDVTLMLNGVGSISGHALDSTGAPTSGDVTVTGNGGLPYTFTVQAQADGTFALPQVLAGPFSVTLRAVSGQFTLYGTASGSVPPNQNTQVTVQVQPSGTVTGLVLRSDGTTPAVGANVVLQLDGNRGSVTVQAGNDGRFTARGVPFSTFVVRITDPISTGLALSSGSIATNGQTLDLGSLVLDDQPVNVVSIAPADGAIGVSLTQPIVVTFSDPLQNASGITIKSGTSGLGASSALSSDQKTVTLTGTWPDSAEITVSVSTSVTDIFGRHPLSAVSTMFHTIDTSGPKVSAIAPTAGTIQVAANATVTVTYDEPLAASNDPAAVLTLERANVSVAGTATLTSPATFVFTPTAPLNNDAIYTVKAIGARDVSGNVQTQNFTSTFATTDTIAPVLTVASPANDSWSRNLQPSIQVNAVDPTSGVASNTGTLKIDGQSVTPQVSGATLFFTPAAGLSEGTHALEASIEDRAGNRGFGNSTFKLDATAPSVPVLTGISEGATLAGTLTLGATSSDATSGVSRIDLYVDNSNFLDVFPAAFSTSYNTQSLADGWHVFSAQSNDVAGNVSSRSTGVNALVNNRPLTLTFSAPAVNTQVRDAVAASATASEPVNAIVFTAAGQTVTDDAAPYEATFALAGAPEGPLVITLTATAGSGETAQATRTVVVDRTAPARPDVARITAEPPNNGSSLVFGYSSAVEPNATVEITNTVTNAFTSVRASSDGGFSIFIAGAIDQALSVVAVDAVGNRSESATITIRSTPSLPPSEGSTTLHYDGVLVDRVGGTSGAMTPDGTPDAVFTVSLAIGDGVTRTISYIDLTGPGTRSTRASTIPLGVAQDPGSPLLNNATGQVNFPVTSGTTLTLFAADAGFIQEGSTYTVKAVFTDGSQFVGTYYIVPRDDANYVAHSADISAEPATVTATAAQPGTTTITITNIRDIGGNLVPDGGKIAISVANGAAKNALGSAFASAGGAITSGVQAANNPSFRVFAISGGSVTTTYSSAPVVPASLNGAAVTVQVLGADASDNVLGVEAITSLYLNVRLATDPAIVHLTPSSLYADRADRRAQIRVQVRDAAGNALPDGTKVLLTAGANGSIALGSFVQSAGGQIIGGASSPTSSIYRAFTVSGGIVTAEYSASGISANVGEVKTATIQVLPADANGARTSQNATGLANVVLAGAAKTEVDVSPETVPYVFPNPPVVQVDVHHVHDARARLVPDGANLLLSASANASILGCCFVSSAGGTIADGTVSPTNGTYKYFPLVNNFFRTTWTQQGVQQVDTGQERIAVVQVVPGDNTGARIDQQALGTRQIKILGPMNSRGSAEQSTLFGDGNLQTTTVRFEHILDTQGNPLPDGSYVVVSAASSTVIAGCCYVGSIGGQILNGTPSPTANFKVFTITNGGIDVLYGNQGIISSPTETKTANVVLAQAGASGERLSQQALGIVPVQTVGTASAQVMASPAVIFADGNDHRATITISDIKDLLGRAVPDGTLIGVSAKSSVAFIGCCYIGSQGGTILGGTTATNNSGFQVFPVTNGQVVVQYSSQGMSVTDERIANVTVVAINGQSQVISIQAIGTAPVRLVGPMSVTVAVSPADLTAHAPGQLSQVTLSNLKSAEGLPLPDGTKVGIAVNSSASFVGCCYIGSVGGTILSGGTLPDDGTPAANNGNFKVFTVTGGEVHAVYDGTAIAAGNNEVKVANVQVVPVSSTNDVLTIRALGVAPIRINGVASAIGSGPATLRMPGTAAVTFTNIRDAAGHIVPDGTAVAATVTNSATFTGCCYNGSSGGTILNGNASPSGAIWKWFTVTGGTISIEYSTQGVTAATPNTTRIQLVPARNDGTAYGGATLSGGLFAITLTN